MNDTQTFAQINTPAKASRGWLWVLLACVIYTPFLNFEIGQGNVASDLAAIESLVERHTFFINDSTFADTIDKFRRPDGRFFSQKSTIYHLCAAAVYAPLHVAGYTLRENTKLCLGLLTFVFSIVPMGLLLAAMSRHPWLATLSPRARILFVASFALGSLLTPFAVTFNHYILAALFLLLASSALTRAWPAIAAPSSEINPSALNPGRFIWVGLWISASLACDVPPAFLVFCIIGLALMLKIFATPAERNSSFHALLFLILGAAPLLALYAALNWRIIASPFPPNMHESAMLYYPGSFWSGLRAAAERGEPNYYMVSYPRRLWHATLGHKGIYWMMPLLIAATLAALALVRRRAPGWPFALAAALFPLAAVAVTMRWAFDLSGGAYNIRHVIATTPTLVCVLGHPALAHWRRRASVWLGVAALWGFVIAIIGVTNPWSHNTLSAYPPLENLAQLCLRHPQTLDTTWIGPLIDTTSVEQWNGWLDYGLALQNARDLPAAQAALTRATQLAPGKSLAYYHLGIVEAERRNFVGALAAYDTLLKLEPDNLGGWNNSGLFALQIGDWDRARIAFAHSLKLAPENATGLYGQLLLMQADGRARPDAPELRHALALHPGDPRFNMIEKQWKQIR